MLRVGLTGGIGSGKSTVARVFREHGAHVVDADRVSRDLVLPGSPVLARISRAFGKEVVREDGSLDRAKLGEIVFADAGKRRVLEGILHPLILDEVDRRVDEIAARDPHALVVVEAALIVELGRQAEFDRVVVVWCEEEQQLRRIMGRDLLTMEEARRRIGAQLPLEEKRRAAHFVVDNSGTPEQCRAEAERVVAELLALAREAGPR